MLKLFGIPNCDTVKKSQKWLKDRGIELNKRSRTWKELKESERSNVTQTKAITLMQQHPTLIKRPVIQKGNIITVGFDDKIFSQSYR